MLYDSNAIVHSPTPILVVEAPVLQAFGKASQIDASWNPQASKNQTAYNQGLVSFLPQNLELYTQPIQLPVLSEVAERRNHHSGELRRVPERLLGLEIAVTLRPAERSSESADARETRLRSGLEICVLLTHLHGQPLVMSHLCG